MKVMIKSFVAIAGISLLSACGEPAPASWNANLDVSCKPQDPFDKASEFFSPKKFWRLQEYDLGTMLAAGQKNKETSQIILDDSLAQKGQYFSRAEKAARDLGLTGKARREHVKDNMDRFNAEVDDIRARLKRQEETLRWVQKCQSAVERELRKLRLSPVEYDPEKRPR